METFRSLRESEGITIYAGVNHFDYRNPIITTKQKEVEDMDYQDSVKVDSPEDWIGCCYNNERIFIFKAESPSEAKKGWKQQIEEQMTDDPDEWDEFEIETEFGTYSLYAKDAVPIEEGLNSIEEDIKDSEADGDSAYGIIWCPAKELISTAKKHLGKQTKELKQQNDSEKQNPRNLENLQKYLNEETGRYDYLNKEFTPKDLIRDGKFIVPIGVWEGDFDCFDGNLTSLKGAPEVVDGSFYCIYNLLTSLQDAPREVSGNFDCGRNQLKSLQGAPRKVGGDFACYYNHLTSLEGAPREVGGDFNCENNNLKSLKGIPEKIGRGFNCHNNLLTFLEGVPRVINGNFDCSCNRLTTLQGAPEKVEKDFDCNFNELISLQGASREVGGYFNCDYNKLKSLQGAPERVGEGFYCRHNPLRSLKGKPEHIGGNFIN